jgi:hypothetical protein
MKLNTKAARLEARNFYRKPESTVIDMPEIEFQAFISEKAGTTGTHYFLTTFTGTAGKPDNNYYYRTQERRDAALQQAIDDQKSRLAYKAKAKEENKGKLTGAAATAAAIRIRLKREFPGIKFSVTSSNFSMGNSVDIHWTDGPRSKDVDSIVDQYQYGHFDGMTDCYNYRDISKDLGCPGAKYVMTQRSLTPEYISTLLKAWEQLHGYEYTLSGGHDNQRRAVNEIERDCPELMPYRYELNQPQKPEPEPEKTETQDPEPEMKSNLLDITARIKARQEKEEAAQDISKFKAEYLPHLSKEDVLLLANVPDDERSEALVKICMRIDLDKGRGIF